jgi:ABC-type multidrug transport system ATPase subunit
VNAIAVTQLAIPFSPIRDVNLQIPNNGATGIIGASGSGKSALLNAIAGLHGTQSHHIRMGAQNVRAATASIGMMSPRLQPPTFLTVQQLLYTQAALYWHHGERPEIPITSAQPAGVPSNSWPITNPPIITV